MDALILLADVAFGFYIILAALNGLKSARDPMHRVTPLNPRIVFWRAFRRRIWIPLIIWCLAVAILSFVPLIMGMKHNSHYPQSMHAMNALTVLTIAVGFQSFFFVATLFFAPRLKNDLWLLVLCCVTAILASGVIICLVMLGLPDNINTLVIRWNLNGVPVDSPHPLFPFYYAAIGLLAVGGIWLWIHRQGEKWFRFEE